MVTFTDWVGVWLLLLGIGGYVASDMVSPTALIPAAFGLVLSMLGFYARTAGRRRTAMHVAMGIALVGIIGTAGGLVEAMRALFAGTLGIVGLAVVVKALMAATLIVYLAAGVRSFIVQRQKAQGTSPR